MTIAPIALFTYNRPSHLKRTVSNLQKAKFADQSHLVVFSDGPKEDSADVDAVESVRQYLASLKEGFKSITVIDRVRNLGLSGNVIDGVSTVLRDNAAVIVLEDDITVSPDFIVVMNDLLNQYRDNFNVGSISGYMYPVEIPVEADDFFLLPRASSWGWATWHDRWKDVDWSVTDYQDFVKNSSEKEKFNTGGDDLTPMLIKWKAGLNDSWAVRWCYHHMKKEMYCLFPKKNMVLNHGNDGSGTHSPRTGKFNSSLSEYSYTTIPKDPKVNSEIVSNLQAFFKLSLQRKFINTLIFWTKNL